MTILFVIACIVLLPPLLYLFVMSLTGLRQPAQLEGEGVSGTIGVLVPSHNEELNIARTIESLQAAAANSHDIEINIVADNCSDNTADIARKFDVNVLERHNLDVRGKGAALQWAMMELQDKDYDFTMIIDADSIVNEEYFVEVRRSLNQPNVSVVQTRYEAIDNEHSSVKRLAMLGFNVLRARGRVTMGGSAGILGNGFVVSKAALQAVPFRANSIVEDLEYHIRLVESGVRVAYANDARIYGEMPQDNAASDVQSSRWEGGRIGVLRLMWWPLLKKSLRGLMKGEFHALDALLDLWLLPIGYVVLILLPLLLVPYVQWIAVFGFISISLYLLGSALCGKGLSELSVLAKVPEFLLRKLLRLPALLVSSSGKTNWNRTPRK